MTAEVTLDTAGLKALMKEVAVAKTASVKVGILAGAKKRVTMLGIGGVLSRNFGETNADIGADHEFGRMSGDIPLPERSFLRMPLMTRLGDRLAAIGDNATWISLIMQFGILTALDTMGDAAVTLIHDAFASGGFGQWKPLAKITVKEKKHATVLIDTYQMEDAVSYKVNAK